MTAKELIRTFPDIIDSSERTFATAGTEIRYDFVNSGTDDETHDYFNLGRAAFGISIRPSDTIQIIKFNGRELKYPITVSSNGLNLTRIECRSLVIRTTASNTNVKVIAK